MRQLAVVVGAGYDSASPFIKLANAPRDARAVADLLTRDYGFELFPANGPLIDSEASLEAIRSAIRSSLEQADAKTRWLFYFAGHGTVQEGQGYLIPADGPSETPANWLALPWLVDACLKSRAAATLIILDACRAGRALVRKDDLSDLLGDDPEANRRLRQILCAGDPDQYVRDGGGEGHSIFTRCLLEALRGWAGIHEPDGSVRFDPLRQYLITEVERRLEKAPGPLQVTVGGNLAGTVQPHGFTFEPRISRVPPETVRDCTSRDPADRLTALSILVEDCRVKPEILPMALRLVLRHLPRVPDRRRDPSGPEPLPVQPEEQERQRAAETLGRLARIGELNRSRVPGSSKVDRKIGATLVRFALSDASPSVRHQARRGLRRVSLETQQRFGRQLEKVWRREDRCSRRRVWEVLVSLQSIRQSLGPLRRCLAYPTLTRLWGGWLWRILTATRRRRWALASPFPALALLYLALGSMYYFSTWGSAVVVRAGHPGLEGLPLVGLPLVITDSNFSRLSDPFLLREERLRGSWLHLSSGSFFWGEQLAQHLSHPEAALSLWRMGHAEKAFARLSQGIESDDAATVVVVGYLALQSDVAVPKAVDLLVSALRRSASAPSRNSNRDEAAFHEAALTALAVIRDTQPAAIRTAVDSLIGRLETASEAEEVALLEAVELLSQGDEPWSLSSVKRLSARLRTAPPESGLRHRVAGALKNTVSRNPRLLAEILPDVCHGIRHGSAQERPVLLAILAIPAPLSPLEVELISGTVIEVLENESDRATRIAAIGTLSGLLTRSPTPATTAVAILLDEAARGDPWVRIAAAEALISLPPNLVPQRAIVQAVAELMREELSIESHRRAIWLLGRFRDPAVQPLVVATLIDAATDWSSTVRREAVYELVELGLDKAVEPGTLEPVLRTALEDQSPAVQQDAAQGFVLLADRLVGGQAPAFDRIIRALTSDDWTEARIAEDLRDRFSRANPAATRQFVTRLKVYTQSADEFKAHTAVNFLIQLGNSLPAVLPDVVEAAVDLLAAEDAGGDVREWAVFLLWSLRNVPAAHREAALDAVFERLAHGSPNERVAAASAIGHLDSGEEDLSDQGLARLIPLLSDREPAVRAASVAALGVIGRVKPAKTRQFLQPLLDCLSRDEPSVRAVCAQVLGRVGFEEDLVAQAIPSLVGGLRDSQAQVRRNAARALSHWGWRQPAGARFALEPLRQLLHQETDPEARVEIASTLGVLGGDDPEIVEEIFTVAETILAAGPDDQRMAAISILRSVGESHPGTAERVFTALLPLLKSPEYWPRQRALQAIRGIGMADAASGAAALELLEHVLFDPLWPDRNDAILNGIRPIFRAHPELAEPTSQLLRAFLDQEFLGPGEENLARNASDALFEVVARIGTEKPARMWRLLTSASSSERQVGRDVLMSIVDQDPDRAPASLARLASYRRSVQPHVRQSAAQAEEMLAILRRNREILAEPDKTERWREVLEWLPRVGVQSAVDLAQKRLEPNERRHSSSPRDEARRRKQ